MIGYLLIIVWKLPYDLRIPFSAETPHPYTRWLKFLRRITGDKNLINTTQISNGSWKNKVLKSLHFNYQKADYFEELYKGLEAVFNRDHSLLIDLNIELITFIKDFLGLSTKLQRSSEICEGTEITSDQKILYVLNKLNATTYVSGAGSGSKRYIDEKEFENNNIDLIWQKFDHPKYPQLFGDFEANLSIIDLLFNCGKDFSRRLLKDIPLTVT